MRRIITNSAKKKGQDPSRENIVQNGIVYNQNANGIVEGEYKYLHGAVPVSIEVYNGDNQYDMIGMYLMDELFIGSSDKADIVFKDDCVAQFNTRIFSENEEICIEDLDSETGTLVSGKVLNEPVPLHDGDIITIGTIEMCIRI
ncbi:MAG: FHA domain-containing protein [Eubacterium sp.]|nr:FHA domain-containing protein [Eubacterium sp.]